MRDINIEKVNTFILRSKDDHLFTSKFASEDLLEIIVEFYDKYLCFHDKQSEYTLGDRLESELSAEYSFLTYDWGQEIDSQIKDFSVSVCRFLRNISQEEFPNNKNIDEW